MGFHTLKREHARACNHFNCEHAPVHWANRSVARVLQRGGLVAVVGVVQYVSDCSLAPTSLLVVLAWLRT